MKKRITAASIVVIALTLLAFTAPSFTQQRGKVSPSTISSKQTLVLGDEKITIIRDNYGVPHIFAESQRGAYYGGGYAVAQDRLYQLERFRRDARGTLAEIEGPLAVARDMQMRVLGYPEEKLQIMFDRLGGAIKQSYQSYADGINAYIEEAIGRGRMPDAFKKAGITRPESWRVTDSVAIGAMMANRFGSAGTHELTNARILKRLQDKFGNEAQAIFNDLLWVNDPKAPTTIPYYNRTSHASSRKNESPLTAFEPAFNDHSLAAAEDFATEREILEYAEGHGLPTRLGSICWALSPKLTASGSAVIVGCPQMSFSAPQIAHEIHYSSGDLNVIGISIAGIPGVIIGHNNHLAWSMTSGLSDLRDAFAEKLNPENRNQYFYKGQYRDIEKRVEVIKVKGQEPRSFEIWRTVHGPLMGWDSQSIEQANVAYSRAASYSGHEISTFEAIFNINYAKNIREFAKIAELIYTNHNFIVATVDGDIGYWHCGRLPVRAKGHNPRLPVPGTGEFDWVGLTPASKLPFVINPQQGYLVNWNNKPVAWWAYGGLPVWGEVDHMPHIQDIIRSQKEMAFERIREISQDISVYDTSAEFLRPYLLAAIQKERASTSHPQIKEAENYLRAWNNQNVDDSVAKTIYDAWLVALRDAIFGDELDILKPPVGPNVFTRVYGLPNTVFNLFDYIVTDSLILHALEGKKSGVPPSRDYFNGRKKDEILVKALVKALDELMSRRGAQMNLWTYTQPDHDFKPLPGIPQTERGTYIFAAEMSKPTIRSMSILAPGQSEDPASHHFGDQREMAGYWRYKTMLYRREQLSER
jgi:penicillin G amidase